MADFTEPVLSTWSRSFAPALDQLSFPISHRIHPRNSLDSSSNYLPRYVAVVQTRAKTSRMSCKTDIHSACLLNPCVHSIFIDGMSALGYDLCLSRVPRRKCGEL